MSFKMTAGAGGGGGEKPPAGNHLAVMVAAVDMGTQLHDYQGKVSWRRDIYLLWELVGAPIAGTTGKNHVIGTALTMSLNEKATLRAWVQARTGKMIADGAEFDITSELGQPCLLNVIEKGGYPRIEGVAAVPKGFPLPTATYKPVAISLDEFKTNPGIIPEWVPWHYGNPLAEHIKACKEIGGPKPVSKKSQQAGAESPSSDGTSKDPIPF